MGNDASVIDMPCIQIHAYDNTPQRVIYYIAEAVDLATVISSRRKNELERTVTGYRIFHLRKGIHQIRRCHIKICIFTYIQHIIGHGCA